jgi:hypothetical protein
MLVFKPYVDQEAAIPVVGPLSSDAGRLAYFAPRRVRE